MAESVQVFSKHFGPWGQDAAPQPAQAPGKPCTRCGQITVVYITTVNPDATIWLCPRCYAAPQPGATAYASYKARQPGWPEYHELLPAARAVWAEIEGTTFVPHCPRCAEQG